MFDVSLKANFLRGLINGEKKICSSIANRFFSETRSIITVYEELLKPSLYMIGDLWEINKISVATEHLASAITESILNDLYSQLTLAPQQNKKVIVTCIEHEHHQIGLKMVSDIFEKEGWDVLFLGANTPEKSLFEFIRVIDPQLLAISLSIYFHIPYFEDLIKKLEIVFPNLNVMVGGQAFRQISPEQISNINNLVYLKNLIELENNLSKNHEYRSSVKFRSQSPDH